MFRCDTLRIIRPTLLAAVIAAAPALAFAATPAQQLQQRYGTELRDRTTRANPQALAERMITDAQELIDEEENLALAELVLDEAYQLASRRTSTRDLALEAAQLMADHVPGRRGDGLSRAASVVQQKLGRHAPADEAELNEQLARLFVDLARHYEQAEQVDAAYTFYQRAEVQARRVPGFTMAPIQSGLRRLGVAREIRDLEQRLERRRTDSEAADRLMWLYLVERDDPASAHRFRFTANDPDLRQHSSLANQAQEHLMAEEMLELAGHYARAAEDASPEATAVMIERARENYQRYLDRSPRDVQQVRRVEQQLAELEQLQAELASAEAVAGDLDLDPVRPPGGDGVPAIATGETSSGTDDHRSSAGGGTSTTRPSPRPGDGDSQGIPDSLQDSRRPADDEPADDDGMWVNLIADLDVSTYGQRGVWAIDGDGELTGSQPTPAQLILPYVPDGDYLIHARFTRTTATGSLAFHLPLGANYHVMLKLGDRRRRQRDHVAGLEMLDNQPSFNNESTVPLNLETDRTYDLEIKVETEGIEVEVTVTLDDEPLIHWYGFRAALSVAPIWEALDQKALGVGLEGGADATFHQLRFRMLHGDYEPLD